MNAKKKLLKIFSAALITVLVAATVLCFGGCKKAEKNPVATAPADKPETTVIGTGATQFTLEVVDKEGKTTVFTVNTDKTTVGAALLELELIAGDESEYGLYVKTVNGVTLDYNTDGYYWAFFINGEYANTGVDSTDVAAGTVYKLAASK